MFNLFCSIGAILLGCVFPVITAAYIIESSRYLDNYNTVLFQTLGIAFIAFTLGTMIQQYIANWIVKKYVLRDDDLTWRHCYCSRLEMAFLFMFVYHPLTCFLIICHINSYTALSLTFLVWPLVLTTAIVYCVLFRTPKT